MAGLILAAPAKVNLFLNIVGRRADGYHELQTAFQLLDFSDELTFEVTDGPLTLDCPALPFDVADNLVMKAAIRLRVISGYEGGAHITLTKRIPAGAGLGGGSSDAATTLLALNTLWQLGLDDQALCVIGRELGADVPVFVQGHSAWAEGVGEQLQPLELPSRWFVIVMPDCHVSTAEIFQHPDLTRRGTPITIARFLEQGSVNVCEPLVRKLYPAVDQALRWLCQWGPARMTGTGSSVFLAVETQASAQEIAAKVPFGWKVAVAQGLNRSPALVALGQILRA